MRAGPRTKFIGAIIRSLFLVVSIVTESSQHRIWICILALSLSSASALLALDPSKHIDQYSHSVWTSQYGLPGHAVYQILQTSDGYLWIRTSAGLVRFDGVRFVSMDEELGSGSSVKAITMGADGNMLVRTTLKTLMYKNGMFSDYLPPRPLPDGAVRTIFESGKHEVFLGSDDFIYLIQKIGIQMLARGTGHIDTFAQGEQGRVWIGGQKSLYSYQNSQLSTVLDLKSWKQGVSALAVDDKHSVWLGTLDGLYRMDHDGKKLERAYSNAIHGDIHAILQDHQGNMWIGTDDLGLMRITGDLLSSFNESDGLTDNKVLCLFEDREGSLWVGTGRGLEHFRNTKVTTLTKKEGLPSDDVRAAFETRDSKLYAFCIPGGLARIENGAATEVTKEAGLSFQGNGVFEAKDGSLWMGTVGGLSRLKAGKFTVYDPGGRFSKRFISSINEDDESLIVTTNETLALRFKDGQIRPFTIHGQTTPLSVPGNYTFSIYRDSTGTLWFGTVKGLFKFAPGEAPMNARQKDVDFAVTSISDDHQGSLWLGGRTPGLTRFRIRDGHVTHYRQKDGLFDSYPSRVLIDDVGNLWISTPSGIYMANRTDLDDFVDGRVSTVRTTVYGMDDGMKTSEANLPASQPAGWRTSDGKLWFTTTEGLVVVDPKHILQNDLIPPVIIEDIAINDRSMPAENGFQIPPGNDKIEIHYTALSLLVPGRVRFKYRLEGYDPKWVDAGVRRVAYYTNLPPGQYRFQVIASNDDGVWNLNGATIRFVLKPHYFQTKWFFALCSVTVIAVCIAGQRIYTRRLRFRANDLEKIVAERTKDLQSEIVERQRAELVADGANRAKSMFLANMSHELRTPLNAILGYAQLLKRNPNMTQGQADAYNTIQQSGEHLLMLITDILDLSKIEAGKIELHTSPVDMVAFLNGIANIIRIRAEEKHLDFEFDIASDLPRFVQADPKSLRQVLLNLLSNAVKFTDVGVVQLKVQALPRSRDPMRLRFAVRDSGTGIAADQLEKIFRPFEQVGDERHRMGGTGLGLSISRQLVRLMGSDIEVESIPGQGSCFSFEMPTLLVDSAQIVSQISGPVTGYSGPRKKVMVVDDTEAHRSVLTETLRSLGFEVCQAVNGLEALTLAQLAPPDLILMDIRMPVMDGLEAIRRMQQLPDLCMVPVIAVSAGVTGKEQAECMTAGAKAFLTKPIEDTSMLQELGKLLNLDLTQETVQPTAPTSDRYERFVIPHPEQMELLHKLAKAGNMRAVKEKAVELATLDEQFRPFADRIVQLAQAYQSKALLRLVEKYAPQKQAKQVEVI